MNKELLQRVSSLPQYAKFYIYEDKDLQADILDNNMTDEEILREVDFQIEQMRIKKKPITIRLSEYDIFRFKQKAYYERIPYQTLINQTLHKADI